MNAFDDIYTTRASGWPVTATVRGLAEAIAERGMTIFATIDQRDQARSVGLALRETVLIIFGNPVAGTPVMDAEPLAGLDLPLKLMVWDDDGATRVSYLAPAALAHRYHLRRELAATLDGIDRLVDSVLTASYADTPSAAEVLPLWAPRPLNVQAPRVEPRAPAACHM